MTLDENNGAYGDRYEMEIKHDIQGIIVCEMNKDAEGWSNVKKQSADCLIVSGTDTYKIYC